MGSKRVLARVPLAVLIFAAAAATAYAQSSLGSVRGTVQDEKQGLIPGADVALTNTGTGVVQKTVTNAAGAYVFPSVVPGPYRLAVTFPGMSKFEGLLTVRVQSSEVVDVTLKVGATETLITVQDVAPLITTDRPTLGHVLERQRIEQLPINGRALATLLVTVPGMDPGQSRAYGVRQGAHDYIFDGASLVDALDGEGTLFRPPGLDTVQEFNVAVNAVSAKYPRMTNIVISSKSGTNDIHGSVFETNRDNYVGAARRRQDYFSKPPQYIRNEYGASAGGPVYIPKIYNGRGKTFWFFAWEGLKLRQALSGLYRVPTAAMRQGDFSGLVNSQGQLSRLYDPWTTDGTTWARQPYPNNQIPVSRMSPLAKYVFSVIPAPNNPTNPLLDANWVGSVPYYKEDQYTVTTRFDHQFTSRDPFYSRFTRGIFRRHQQISGGNIIPTDNIANTLDRYFPNISLSANWNHSFSPTFYNELLTSASRESGYIMTGAPGVDYSSQLGLPNPLRAEGYPWITNIGLSPTNYMVPTQRRDRYFNFYIFDDNMTKIAGKHEFQFGAHARFDQLTVLPQQTNTSGVVDFGTNATGLYDPATSRANPGVTPLTGQNIANLFIGVANYSINMAKGKYYIRQREFALYFQDNYRVTPRLTLNLGLRWQFTPYPFEKNGVLTSFDRATKTVILGQPLETLYKLGATVPSLVNTMQAMGVKFKTYDQVGLPRKLVHNNWRDYGPRLGFAYRAMDGRRSFVIRGGYALTYFPMPLWSWNDEFIKNIPFTATFTNSSTDAAQSPDGLANYALRSVPSIIAGANSQNALTVDTPRGLTRGGSSFTVAYWDPHQPTSRVHDWNLTLEKEVMADTLARVAYVGNHLAYQDMVDNYNDGPNSYIWYTTRKQPLPTGDYANALVRPYDQTVYGRIEEFRKDGWGNYGGMQFELEKRYSKGFSYQISYNVGNALRAGGNGYGARVPNTGQFLPGTVPTDLKDRMRLLMYGLDTSVPKHWVKWNWLFDMPFGRGRRWGSGASRWQDLLIGGWQLAGIGQLRRGYFSLPTSVYPISGNKIEVYGYKYPIKDCRSGTCYPGYLWWNGYIPANQINSTDASGKPNGVMGVPDSYKPAGQPLIPWPASPNRNDPMYAYYGTNTVWIPLDNGTLQRTTYDANMHPWSNQYFPAPRTWTVDASLFKTFRIREAVALRLNVDLFNAFNMPGTPTGVGSDGVVSTRTSGNTARQLQLTLRLNW
ncbi:MAG: TonB-dependent receptor [Bryobacteraceae bacterium]